MDDELKERDIHDNEDGTTNSGTAFVETDDGIRRINMDDGGKLITSRSTAVALPGSSRIYVAAGWLLAALTAFIWPYFAVLGIVSGFAANIKARGSGNAVIVSNIVFAAVNLVFWYFLSKLY